MAVPRFTLLVFYPHDVSLIASNLYNKIKIKVRKIKQKITFFLSY